MNPTPAPAHPLPRRVSEIFDPARWREVPGFTHAQPDAKTTEALQAQALTDVTYHRGCLRSEDGTWLQDLPVVRVAFNRPEVRNAFRPRTVDELYRVLDHARMSGDVGAVILTGNGPSPRDGGWAFSSGGDQRIRGRDGYRYEREHERGQDPGDADGYSHEADVAAAQARLDTARAGRLHILEVQRLIRTMPKVVIAAVPGWAAGGGHSLNVVADLSLASIEHARFKQTDADVGSFDAGYGSALLARQVGDKRAREIFFLARTYDAVTAERWGVVNEAVPHAELEERALEYAATVASKSPQAIRMLKLAFNLADDGLAGQQVFAGEATRLAYMTDEAVEGRDAFLQRRAPDWSPFPYYF
ncbi:1,4-dihydroxy-2-naphthoyl-CoA synthase [Actinomyces viscosus]|uniref:1,4-dihydroxy-2-naphthoyl-CoA synthase n=1 Tax=Actinomyces viscosus TaxID=1656 RepID=A0A448PLC3_ACTVI|nr:1,4-dihydroxy-2-naphthoyl-CoA synthase [Actinomyces viscosus]TFH52558.1 1,4-dihydroxy-2-naphthoyl-CoA synthase [Actinomyces viscosus]VEI16354.1 1,4-Dihydroxy-2-naphthoyl-CoA synthase [Actinomyces viscosus]